MHSYSAFCHEADSSVAESRGSYLLECAEVLFQLYQGEEHRSLDQLLSVFQRADFALSSFRKVLKSWKQSSHILFKPSKRYAMKAKISKEFIDLEQVEEVDS